MKSDGRIVARLRLLYQAGRVADEAPYTASWELVHRPGVEWTLMLAVSIAQIEATLFAASGQTQPVIDV